MYDWYQVLFKITCILKNTMGTQRLSSFEFRTRFSSIEMKSEFCSCIDLNIVILISSRSITSSQFVRPVSGCLSVTVLISKIMSIEQTYLPKGKLRCCNVRCGSIHFPWPHYLNAQWQRSPTASHIHQ